MPRPPPWSGAARFWDTYHRKWVGMDDVAHFLVSYQHIFFYPLMALGRWNLYAQASSAAPPRPRAPATVACAAPVAASILPPPL